VLPKRPCEDSFELGDYMYRGLVENKWIKASKEAKILISQLLLDTDHIIHKCIPEGWAVEDNYGYVLEYRNATDFYKLEKKKR